MAIRINTVACRVKPRITPFTTITTVVNLEATMNLGIIKNVEATDPAEADLEVAQMVSVEAVEEVVVAEGNYFLFLFSFFRTNCANNNFAEFMTVLAAILQ